MHHVRPLCIMCGLCVSCAASVYHVQPLCIMCGLCVSCAASVYHVRPLCIMCGLCVSCAASVYHVQPLCIMCSLCVSCAASVYHVCVAPGFQGTRSPLCITCTQLYHILLLLLCTALKMLSGEINACNKHLFIYLYILCVVCGLSVQRSGSCTSDSAMCVCDNAQGISIQLLCILIDIALHSYRH